MTIDGATYMAIECHGLDWLPLNGRQTLASMAIELGAKAGIFCVATVQIALSALMGTFARTNFSNRIAVGPAERGALELIFGSLADDSDVMELRRRIKGRGLINSEVGLDAIQVPYFEREFIPQLLTPHLKGVTP